MDETETKAPHRLKRARSPTFKYINSGSVYACRKGSGPKLVSPANRVGGEGKGIKGWDGEMVRFEFCLRYIDKDRKGCYEKQYAPVAQ